MTLLRPLLTLLFILTATFVHAETIQVTGRLTVSQISIQENVPVNPTAYSINPITISLSNTTPTLCTLGSTKPSYNSPTIDCILTWKNHPASLTPSGLALSGKLTSPVSTTIEYEIAVMVDGRSDRRVVKTGQIALNVLPPPQPVISKATVNTQNTAFVDLTQSTVFTTKTYTYPKLGVNVEPRGYDQRITLSYPQTYLSTTFTSCDIPAGQTTCNSGFLPTLNDDYGLEPFTFSVACTGTCSGIESYASSLSTHFEWDYRPPINTSLVATLRQGASTNPLTPTVNNLRNGETFTITLGSATGGTAALSNGNTSITFHQSGMYTSTARVNYTILTNQGRQANGVMNVTVLVNQTLDAIRMPLLVSGFETPFQYTSARHIVLPDNTRLEGNIPVKLTIPSTAALGVKVNGQTLTPGAEINTTIAFTNGVPQISVEPSARILGEDRLTIEPNSTMYPVAFIDYSTYEVTASITSPQTVAAGFEEYRATVKSNCYIRSKEEAELNSSYCYLEWTLPSGLSPTPTKHDQVSGFVGTGNHIISYTLKAVYSGNHLTMATGTASLTATVHEYDFNITNTPIYRVRGIQRHYLISMNTRTDPLRCTFYAGEIVATTQTDLNRGKLSCHVEWVHLPEGYSPYKPTSPDVIEGLIVNPSDNKFHYIIKAMLPNRAILTLQEKQIDAEVISPIPPVLDITPYSFLTSESGDYLYDTGSKSMIIRGNALGDAPMNIDVYDGDTLIGSSSPSLSGRVYSLPIPTSKTTGTVTDLRLHTYYRSAPEISSDKVIRVIAIPNSYVKPEAEIGENYTDDINTQLGAIIKDTDWRCRYGRRECTFSKEAYGEWNVFLSDYAYKIKDINRLTESVRVNNQGRAIFSLDLPAQTKRYTFVGELLGQDNSVVTQRLSNAFDVVVLKKTPIDGTATVQKISGKAPFTTSLRFIPDELEDGRNIKKIIWEANDGTGWNTINRADARTPQVVFWYMFTAGTYRIRAQVYNKFDVPFTTEEIELEAFHVPKITIEGPHQVLPGRSSELVLLMDGQPVDLDRYTTKWTINDEILTDIDRYTISSQDVAKFKVNVKATLRHISDNPDATKEATKYVSFFWPKYIYVNLDVPTTIIENGSPVTFTATLQETPLNGTMDGEWMLPDGTVHAGTTVNYTPPVGYNGLQRVTFTGWFQEYPSVKTYLTRTFQVQSANLPEMSIALVGDTPSYKAPVKILMELDSSNLLSTTQIGQLQIEPSVNKGKLTMTYGGSMFLDTIEGGDHKITLNIANKFGASKQVTYTVPVEMPDPINIQITPYTSTDTFKAPGSFYFDAQVQGVAANDGILYQYVKINGVIYSTSSYRSRFSVKFQEPGRYDVSVQYRTKRGMESSRNVIVDIK